MDSDPGPASPWPAIDIVYQELIDRAKGQQEHIKILDTKANFGLGSATILTASLALQQAAESASAQTGWSGAVVVVALVAYLVVVISSFSAYRLRQVWVTPDPIVLTKEVVYETPDRAKSALSVARAEALVNNEEIIRSKVFWTKNALAGLFVEALALLIIAVAQMAL